MDVIRTDNIVITVSKGDDKIYHVTSPVTGDFLGYILTYAGTYGFSQEPSIEILLANEMFDIATAVNEIDKALTE